MTLTAVLESLAVDTWERLRDAGLLEINLGEETITDLLLLDLKRKQPPGSRIIQTKKSKEKDQGTDWEWWVGSDQRSWMRFAVQAKKLHAASDRYTGLSHKVDGTLQIDLLERFAAANDAVPIYCLYNYRSTPDTDLGWHCCDPKIDRPQLACTITPSTSVRHAINNWGQKSFLALHSNPKTIPWRCLTKCPKINTVSKLSAHSAEETPKSEKLIDHSVRRYPRLPPEVQEGRLSGRVESFSTEFYDHEVGLYPRRVVVLDFAQEESPNVDG